MRNRDLYNVTKTNKKTPTNFRIWYLLKLGAKVQQQCQNFSFRVELFYCMNQNVQDNRCNYCKSVTGMCVFVCVFIPAVHSHK